MKTVILDSAKAIDVDEWDGLAARAGTVYSSHAWLAFGEGVEPDLVARHLEVRDGSGRLRAAVPVYEVGRPANAHYSADRLFPDVRAGLDDAPHLLVGGSRGYNGALHIADDDPDAEQLVGAVLASLADLEGGLGDGGWSLWAYVPSSTARRVSRSYGTVPRLAAGDCWIPCPRTGWEGYLAALPSRRRQTIRRERAKFAAAGLRIVEAPLGDWLPDVGRLMALTQSRYGFDVSAEGMTDLMRTQSEAFGDRGRVHLCADANDRILGCAVFYDFGTTRYARAAGFDYEALPGVHEYFETCVYSAIEAAHRAGLDTLHLGMSSYDAKTLRGARISPRWMVTSSADTWGEQAAHTGSRTTADEIAAQVPSIGRALVPGDDGWVQGLV